MRFLRIAALFLLCAVVAGAAPSARRARAATLDEGLALYGKADFAGALKSFDAVARSGAPRADRARAYQYAALMHVAMGKAHFADAERAIRTMVSLDPSVKPDPEEFPENYMRIYYKAAQTGGSFKEAAKPGVTTLAIMDFDNTSIGSDAASYANLGRGLSQMLITDLVGVSSLKLVEREKIQYILDELKLSQAGQLDPSTAAKVGKLVGAQVLLFGGAMVNDKKLIVSWRLVKVETSEILKASNTEGDLKKFSDVEKKLALGLTEDLKVAVAPETMKKIEAQDRPGVDAAMAYSEGLKHMDEGHVKAACEKFEEASKLDPQFAAARRRAAKLKPLAQAS